MVFQARRAPFGSYAARHKELREIGERQRDQLAELVSEGWSLSAAGREIGVKQQRASQIFAAIKRDLGWQAQ